MRHQVEHDDPPRGLTPRRITIAVITAVLVIFGFISSFKIFEDVGPDEIAVIQSPIAGQLDVYTTPGVKWQGFGEVTDYKKRSVFNFEGTTKTDEKTKAVERTGGIEVRFNDGGHGTIYGSVQYELPLEPDQVREIHQKFRTQTAIQQQLIETVTKKSVYLVGPLMSSRESYSEKRNDLIHYIADQIQNGVYRTRQRTTTVVDPITNQSKTVTIAEIVMDKDGKPERQEEAVLNQFGIHAFNFTITNLAYDNDVEGQIKQQQQLAMNVQTSIAQLREAEQRRATVEEQGRANAAEAKWKQETIKAQHVTKAEQEKQVAELDAAREREVALIQGKQRLEVADLDKKAAELTKEMNILLGQGESERRRAVLEADGALTQKLEAYIKVNSLYADAISKYTGNWVPSIVMGGGSSNQSSTGGSAMDFLALLTAKAAKDLALDLGVRSSPSVPTLPRRPAQTDR